MNVSELRLSPYFICLALHYWEAKLYVPTKKRFEFKSFSKENVYPTLNTVILIAGGPPSSVYVGKNQKIQIHLPEC